MKVVKKGAVLQNVHSSTTQQHTHTQKKKLRKSEKVKKDKGKSINKKTVKIPTDEKIMLYLCN